MTTSTTITKANSSRQKSKTNNGHEVAQFGRFGLVGILNTSVDFLLLNILTLVFGMGVVIAGTISGTIAMINSFVFNQRFTFRTHKTTPRQTAWFFGITIFGIYVIRPLVVNFFAHQWLWPAHIVYRITNSLHLPLSQSFDTNNIALVAAVGVVLFYNYFLYKEFVFNS